MSSTAFQAEPLNILEIWDTKVSYECPLFQRKYTWGEPQWADFWSDIEGILDESTRRSFLGALVLKVIAPPLGTKVGTTWIVDGQQRLTTVYLVLLALGALAKDHGDKETLFQVQELICYKKGSNQERFPRLLPTMADLPILIGIHSGVDELRLAASLGAAKTGVGAALTRAYRHQTEKVEGLLVVDGTYNVELAGKLLNVLTTSLDFVTIYLDDEHDPQEVFDRLNQGGKKLALSDLLKNIVFSALGNSQISYAEAQSLEKNEWNFLMEGFSENADDAAEIFGEYVFPFGICVKPSTTKGKVVSDIENSWNGAFGGLDPSTQIRERILNLRQFQEEFMALRDPRLLSGVSGELQRAVDSLRRTETPNSVLPYAMQLIRSVRLRESNEANAISCLQIIEAFLMRRALTGVEPTGLHAVFKTLWSHASDDPADVRRAIETATVRMPSDREVREEIGRSDMYRRKKCKIILREYEIWLREQSPEDFDNGELENLTGIQVDHIMPRANKGSAWPQLSAKDEPRLNQWGNLVLLTGGANATKGRKSWPDTRKLLQGQSKFLQAREVVDHHTDWSVASIINRNSQMADWAIVRWPAKW